MNILYPMIYWDQNNTHHKVWKMENIFQNEVIGDILVWKFRWKNKMI